MDRGIELVSFYNDVLLRLVSSYIHQCYIERLIHVHYVDWILDTSWYF